MTLSELEPGSSGAAERSHYTNAPDNQDFPEDKWLKGGEWDGNAGEVQCSPDGKQPKDLGSMQGTNELETNEAIRFAKLQQGTAFLKQ